VTFLPIVERELRVASRKRSTFWVRIIAALTALVISAGFLILSRIGWGLGAATMGKALFSTLTWLTLAAALSAGLFFTSDCLSEEKREGTLGFLFLTDLRGYDVVVGKLLATSLRGFYALLALLPILAIALLMGGVTGAQFWKTALALVNALFFSLAVGLFVSAISRDSQKALAVTVLLLVLLVAIGPGADAILAEVNQRNFNPALSLSSPGYLFVAAGVWGKNPFWLGLLVNQAMAWLSLGATCLLLPRTWQEKAASSSTRKASQTHAWKFGGAKRHAALHRKLIDVNPVLWLACRERWQSALFWLITLLVAGGTVAIFVGVNRSTGWLVWSSLGGALTLVLYLGIASQAGRFLVEARRGGLIELLLATPLTVLQIVQGQWRALLRMFGPPVALWLAAQLLGQVMLQRMTWSRFNPPPVASTVATGTTSPVASATNSALVIMTNSTMVTTTTTTATATTVVSFGPISGSATLVAMAIAIAGTLTTAANLVALCWFGMWMGMTSKNTSLATLNTIVFVQVIPWFAVSFTSGIAMALLMVMPGIRNVASTTQMMIWYPLITSGLSDLLFVAKDIAFVIWSRRKLYGEFRERAGRSMVPIRSELPPPLPPTSTPPPIAPN